MQAANKMYTLLYSTERSPNFSCGTPLAQRLEANDEASQGFRCHLPCSQERANAPSKPAVLFEHRSLVVPPQHHPKSAHEVSASLENEVRDFHLCTHNSQILQRSRRLNVIQRLLQFPQFLIHPPLRLLRALHSLHFKRLNGFDLSIHIVRSRFEGLDVSFDLVDDPSVAEGAAVTLEVDGLGLRL